MNRGRDIFTPDSSKINRNRHEFEYDSADLPFSPPTHSSGYLESGLPFWKPNITDPDKYLYSPAQTSSGSDQPFTPLLKIATSGSRSNENVTSEATSYGTLSIPLVTQSLPSTPAQTPLTTPVPTPQSSPSVNRKISGSEMEAVCRMTGRLNQEQLPSNARWLYLGFRSAKSPSDTTTEDLSRSSDSHLSTRFDNVSKTSEFRPLSYLQKRALAISNRDMNFLAPTSM